MKIVFGILALITFLFIGLGFTLGLDGRCSWAALSMTVAIIFALLAACAGADIYETPYRRRKAR